MLCLNELHGTQLFLASFVDYEMVLYTQATLCGSFILFYFYFEDVVNLCLGQDTLMRLKKK